MGPQMTALTLFSRFSNAPITSPQACISHGAPTHQHASLGNPIGVTQPPRRHDLYTVSGPLPIIRTVADVLGRELSSECI